MMIPEAKLTSPIIASIVAAICFTLAYKARLPEGWRYLFIFFGVIAALWAFVTGADWLISRLVIYIKQMRQAWFSPTLAIASTIASMNRDQLRLFERVGPFESIGYLGNTGMRWMLYTPMGEIPYSWITNYLDDCERSYPDLKPQHGMPDSLQRDYVRWFTGLMVNNGLADKPVGSRPARWQVPIELVYEKLGLREE
jgi:hypothetical protein